MSVRERGLSPSLRRHGLALAVAAGVFVLAYDNGAYSVQTRAATAVLVWWAVLCSLIVGVGRVERLGTAGRWVGGGLGALALWTLASSSWSSSAEAAVIEWNRVALYVGIFLLVGLHARSGRAGPWLDGIAIGVAAVAVVALLSRLFPTLFSQRGLPTFLPSAQTRLSFPLGYWNGLGIFCALGVPLLLRIAVVARSWITRGLALAPIPVVGADIYLASSRGAVAALGTGVIVLLVASSRRRQIAAALVPAAVGTAIAVGTLVARSTLVDGPLGGAAARSEGRSAAVLIVLACSVTAGSYALGCRYWPSEWRLSRRSQRAVAVAAVLIGLGLVVAAHPVRRFEVFKQPPQQFEPSEPGGVIRAHLLSGNGSGRWEFWTSAVDEWKTKPLVGRGAGSYEAWWAQHGGLAYFVKDAHSLYLETLGELGIVGLLLLVGVLVGGIAVGVSRLGRLDAETRVMCASLIAVVAGFGVGAGLDWIWELTAVTVVAVACLALLVCAATLPRPSEAGTPRLGMTVTGRRVAIGAVTAAAVVAVLSAGDQLIGETKLEASRSATADRNLTRAFDDALDARDLQPWAATPYLQLALVAERQDRLRTASSAIEEATDRAPQDWRLWLVRARIETKRGMVKAGLQSLRRARALNPRSPLFFRQ
jgi:hypothetical protein